MVVGDGGVFDRRDELIERLQHSPGEEARQEVAVSPTTPPPSRWTLRTIRATFPWLQGYSMSGVWRILHGWKLKVRSAQVQHYSPDPEYCTKLAHLEQCLQAVARAPDAVVVVFMDQMGFTRWPEPAPVWAEAGAAATPIAERSGPNNQQWRIIGGVNAWTGQVDYLDAYIVGRAKVIAFYQQVAQVYASAQRIYVVQDNWSIHRHPEVMAALARLPQIEPVWLPTYAPWLNPIEKVWRWLRQDILKQHRLAGDWAALQQRVRDFLDQFAQGSRAVLHYVGLLGNGRLAQALHPS